MIEVVARPAHPPEPATGPAHRDGPDTTKDLVMYEMQNELVHGRLRDLRIDADAAGRARRLRAARRWARRAERATQRAARASAAVR